MSTYQKACKGRYIEKFSKNGNLIRTAEQFDSGMWVVHEYSQSSRLDLSGEYTDRIFKKEILNRGF